MVQLTEQSVTTNNLGEFVIKEVPVGQQTLMVSQNGYTAQKLSH